MLALLIVIGIALLGVVATYLLERRNKRRKQRLAETTSKSSRVGHNDGMDNPIAAEAVLREGWRPPNTW